MSIKHETLFYERMGELGATLNGSQYAVLNHLANRANAEGVIEGYPQAAIGLNVGYDRKTVRTALQALEKRGLIQREKVMDTGYARYADQIILHLDEVL